MTKEEIIQALPYGKGFHFVDELTYIDHNRVEGSYTFKPDAPWYRDHFPEQPITPGVILIECMAQIGLVCLGLYLVEKERPGTLMKVIDRGGIPFLFSQSEVLFSTPVLPGDRVRVVGEKRYWRLGKLRTEVKMISAKDGVVAQATLSGMRPRELSLD